MQFSPESATKIIGAIIVPAVMVSTCALLLNGVILRYRAVDDLLRSFNREWLTIVESKPDNSTPSERLYLLDRLIPKLLHHHHLLHQVLTLIYAAILTFVFDMLVIAISESAAIIWLPHSILLIFMVGVGILCWALTLTCYELYIAHDFIQMEMERSCRACNSKQIRKYDRPHLTGSGHHH